MDDDKEDNIIPFTPSLTPKTIGADIGMGDRTISFSPDENKPKIVPIRPSLKKFPDHEDCGYNNLFGISPKSGPSPKIGNVVHELGLSVLASKFSGFGQEVSKSNVELNTEISKYITSNIVQYSKKFLGQVWALPSEFTWYKIEQDPDRYIYIVTNQGVLVLTNVFDVISSENHKRVYEPVLVADLVMTTD